MPFLNILNSPLKVTAVIVHIEYPVVRRTEKTMKRIDVKKAMTGRQDLGFKTNCDLMAFRIFTNPESINTVTRNVALTEEQKGNKVRVRSSIQNRETGEIVDIIQYMYVYHKDLGYLAEYQIGHPFAPWKFDHDSAYRDGKPGAINFRDAKIKLYDRLKEQLLDPVDNFDYAAHWRVAFEREPPADYMACFSNMV